VELNLLISLAGILGAGLSSYVGVRVALAELRGEVKRLNKEIMDLESRADRLEKPYFNRRDDPS